MSKTNNKLNVVEGLLIGTAIGGIAGLLLAPRTGKETRRIIQKSAQALPEIVEDLTTTVQQQADRYSGVAKRNLFQTINRLKFAIAVGIETSQLEAQQIKQSLKQENDR